MIGPEDDLRIETMTRVSETGHAIGRASGPNTEKRAVVVRPDGAVQALSAPGGAGTRAMGLNRDGDVVGATTGQPRLPLLWKADGRTIILADRLSSPLPDGFELLSAKDINNAGEVVATAVSGAGCVHLVTLTPDRGDPATYTPRVLGEIFPSADLASQRPILLSERGAIAGFCSAAAPDCPAENVASASLDPNITNLFTGSEPAQAAFQPLISRTAFGRPPAGGPGTAPAAVAPAAASFDRARPDFGDPVFPTLGPVGTGAAATPEERDDTSPGTVPAPVPLPGAGVLLLLGLILVRGASRSGRMKHPSSGARHIA